MVDAIDLSVGDRSPFSSLDICRDQVGEPRVTGRQSKSLRQRRATHPPFLSLSLL